LAGIAGNLTFGMKMPATLPGAPNLAGLEGREKPLSRDAQPFRPSDASGKAVARLPVQAASNARIYFYNSRNTVEYFWN